MHMFARRVFYALFATLLVAAPLAPARAAIPFFTSQPKYAAIVVDAKSGEVLYAHEADSPRYPASITKIMTLYLTFEALSNGRLSQNDMITVSPRAAAQAPSKLGLRPGQTISVSDAMHAVAVKSANDMAVALAEKVGGSESRFAAMMTLKAQELGMNNSHFVNASGLPDTRQLTSARDIAILSRAVMRDYPQYYSLFGTKQFVWHGQQIKNHNGLLGKMQGLDGIKTGFTNASGFNLAASAVRDNRRLIAVVMGGSSTAARDAHVEDLLETGFMVLRKRAIGENTTIAQNLSEPAPIGPVDRPPVEQGDGEQDSLKIVVGENNLHAAPAPAATPAPTVVASAPDADAQPAKGAGRTTQKDLVQKQDRPSRAERGQQRLELAAAKGAWQVQLGSYKNRRMAQDALAKLNSKFAAELRAARGRVDRSAGNYRVRFAGLSEGRAREACETIKSKGAGCLALGPG
ncbi:MAG TPA: D-alanyl-D-alanine carboxypeptidase [Caulobacteraceae bacterium]|nr:D-alanyl-D-alanine carboxypeptidase [Caulobacteraceae bacterium]